MGSTSTNPYQSQSSVGYNLNPPPDDGTVSEANRTKWQTVLDKLTNVLKIFAELIDSTTLASFAKTINTDDNVKNNMTGSLGFGPSELTIASGSVAATRTYHTIDTESDTASDDLDTITVAGVADDAILIITAANTARTVVVKHATDNINLTNGLDFTIDDNKKSLILQRRGANWHEISSSERTLHTNEFFTHITSRDDGTLTPYTGQQGDFPIAVRANTAAWEVLFYMPLDFISLTAVDLVMIPDATETVQLDVTTEFGAAGESSTTHSDSLTNETLAVTFGIITEFDLSEALTGIGAGDYVGMDFNSDTTSLQLLGLRVKYVSI